MKPLSDRVVATTLAVATLAAFATTAAFAAGPHGVPAARAPHPRENAASKPVRVLAIAGDGQSAHAFAASTGPGYETVFAQPLVVRVDAAGAARNGSRRVRFTCADRGCRFPPSEQGDDVTRVDRRTYEVRLVDGRATLPVTLSTDEVPGTFTVDVRPVLGGGERAAAGARFRLHVR